MPGLSLGAGAQVRAGSQAQYGTANPATSTAYAAGFGIGSDGTGSGKTGLAALMPNDPAGVAFWFGVASTIMLVLMYQSLPE
jgi:hypothetical protein